MASREYTRQIEGVGRQPGDPEPSQCHQRMVAGSFASEKRNQRITPTTMLCAAVALLVFYLRQGTLVGFPTGAPPGVPMPQSGKQRLGVPFGIGAESTRFTWVTFYRQWITSQPLFQRDLPVSRLRPQLRAASPAVAYQKNRQCETRRWSSPATRSAANLNCADPATGFALYSPRWICNRRNKTEPC